MPYIVHIKSPSFETVSSLRLTCHEKIQSSDFKILKCSFIS